MPEPVEAHVTSRVSLLGWPDDDPEASAHDVLCHGCGQTSRLHPNEPLVRQLHLFLDQHRTCLSPEPDPDALD